ncbi:MAG TPA: hypothetical protein PLC07_12080 [Bacillota bacterium]|nr:hypothetical protein [Bacillota bacterium]
MSIRQVEEAAQNCRRNAEQLRQMAQNESNPNVQKLLLEAAHHLDVGLAELEYIITESTVSI